MTYTKILKEISSVSPPIQPKVNVNVTDYNEKLLSWNPVCIKKDALFYQFVTDKKKECYVDLVPDACMNILFKCDEKNPTALLSGIFVEQKILQLEPNTTYFGVKPYSLLGMKHDKGLFSDLRNTYTDFEYVFPYGEELMGKISSAQSFDQRIDLFKAHASKHIVDVDYVPNFIDYLSVWICASKGQSQVNSLQQTTGYSERYCREKFKNYYGLSLKKYSRIMRFQNVLKMLLNEDCEDTSGLVFDNGYFDQAHLINDFKKFTTSSPTKFKQNYVNLKNTTG